MTQSVPSTDHVGRYCTPKYLLHNLEDEGCKYLGVTPEAFRFKEDGVSVAWLEHAHHDTGDAIQHVFRCLRSSGFVVRQSHRLAKFSVQDILDCGTKFKLDLQVISDPQANFECHALITRIDTGIGELLEAIAQQFLSMHAMVDQ